MKYKMVRDHIMKELDDEDFLDNMENVFLDEKDKKKVKKMSFNGEWGSNGGEDVEKFGILNAGMVRKVWNDGHPIRTRLNETETTMFNQVTL